MKYTEITDPLDRKVGARAWIRRHKNDDPNDMHLYVDTNKEDADKWLSQFKPGYAWLEPLVSVEMLATQWETTHGFDKHGVAEWLRSNVELSGAASAGTKGYASEGDK
jgi:hypothetical protein